MPAFGLLDRMRDVLAECLDRRAQIDPGRSIVVTDWRDLRIDSEKLIDRHLRGPHRIFDGEDDIFGYFDELTDKGEIPRRFGNRERPFAFRARHEHARNIGHPAGDAVCRFKDCHVDIEMAT